MIHCVHLACLRNRDRGPSKQFPEIKNDIHKNYYLKVLVLSVLFILNFLFFLNCTHFLKIGFAVAGAGFHSYHIHQGNKSDKEREIF